MINHDPMLPDSGQAHNQTAVLKLITVFELSIQSYVACMPVVLLTVSVTGVH